MTSHVFLDVSSQNGFYKGRSTLVSIVPKIAARWRQMEFCIFCAKSRQNERSSVVRSLNLRSRILLLFFFLVKNLVKMKGILHCVA